MPELLRGLAPVVGRAPRVLILGSMPGAASLSEQRYYAHPANLFWPLMADVLCEPLPAEYAERLEMLKRRGIALWDVVGECRRSGSLDSAIVASSVVSNDIPALVSRCPSLRAVFFNGATAERLFLRHFKTLVQEAPVQIAPTPTATIQTLCYDRLPSTSPANASQSRALKRAAWASIGSFLDDPAPN